MTNHDEERADALMVEISKVLNGETMDVALNVLVRLLAEVVMHTPEPRTLLEEVIQVMREKVQADLDDERADTLQ
jgi:hypothetical protein